MDTRRSLAHATYELLDTSMVVDVPPEAKEWAEMTGADLPWAEDHFLERVGGEPLNPPPSHVNWPHAKAGNAAHISSGTFSHTYPERYWSKFANVGETRPNGRQVFVPHNGIRYEFGDLGDLVNLLERSPLTRQAYLPVWFPEDTGAVSHQRVPCTLGYHFMIRDSQLSCRYYLRSCDLVRHWHNDLYLTGRLMQWVCDQLNERWDAADPDMAPSTSLLVPGELHVFITSLHAFMGDTRKLEDMASWLR